MIRIKLAKGTIALVIILQIYGTRKQSKRLYYQMLSMKVDEFETKRQFKCIFVTPNLKEEEVLLYPNQNGCVTTLLEECRKKVSGRRDCFQRTLRDLLVGMLFYDMLTIQD